MEKRLFSGLKLMRGRGCGKKAWDDGGHLLDAFIFSHVHKHIHKFTKSLHFVLASDNTEYAR